MNAISRTFLLVAVLLLGVGLGAGGMYAARPLLGNTQPSSVAAPAITDAPAVAPTMTDVPEPAPANPPLPPEAERALEGVRRGEFQPLENITAMLAQRFPGEILGMRLSQDDGRAYYEFKILTRAGRVTEVEVDPRTGSVIDVDEDDDD